MGKRLTRIYTRTGDAGTTGLTGGQRVAKDSPRVEAMGTVDELNSHLGLLLAEALPADVAGVLRAVQNDLFDLGGELSWPGHALLDAARVAALEQSLDALNARLPPLEEFILPGGGRAAAQCHVARSVCRRAERRLVALAGDGAEGVSATALAYLNRLSDWLFVAARILAREAGQGEVYWQSEHSR